MYNEIGQVSKTTVNQLKKLLKNVQWEKHISDITDHHASSCAEQIKKIKGITDIWPADTFDKATFLRLPPGGNVYRHCDTGVGYTIPIETNGDCVSMSYEQDKKKQTHLNVGKIYYTDRSVEHESVNNGKTNRTHLLVILKGDST